MTREDQRVSGSSAAAADFSALLRSLWRAVVRTTRLSEGLPELPESQVDALRVLAQAGPMTPGALADELRLARTTVSNLLRDLVSAGLVERCRSGADGRSAILVPTTRALTILETFARARVEVIETLLARLSSEDLRSIEGAIPALHRLLAELDAEVASRSASAGQAARP